MLSKFLITLIVVVIAFFVIRQRNLGGAHPTRKSIEDSKSKKDSSKDEFTDDLRKGAYIFLALMISLGATLYYFDWKDDHTVVTIYLHRSNGSQPVSYQAYKYQLQDRSFVTIDGRSITVASSERMEILGLNK